MEFHETRQAELSDRCRCPSPVSCSQHSCISHPRRSPAPLQAHRNERIASATGEGDNCTPSNSASQRWRSDGPPACRSRASKRRACAHSTSQGECARSRAFSSGSSGATASSARALLQCSLPLAHSRSAGVFGGTCVLSATSASRVDRSSTAAREARATGSPSADATHIGGGSRGAACTTAQPRRDKAVATSTVQPAVKTTSTRGLCAPTRCCAATRSSREA
eukprot:6187436-Pleurochrysis_carterae.AAC.4